MVKKTKDSIEQHDISFVDKTELVLRYIDLQEKLNKLESRIEVLE